MSEPQGPVVAVLVNANMELFKSLFSVVLAVVVVSICDVSAQGYWTWPVQKHHPPPPPLLQQQQLTVLPPAAPFDKCQVEESEKIQCGTRDIEAEQCENINCCFNGRQCYYGKAGICDVWCGFSHKCNMVSD